MRKRREEGSDVSECSTWSTVWQGEERAQAQARAAMRCADTAKAGRPREKELSVVDTQKPNANGRST